jgi:hypothetical protein
MTQPTHLSPGSRYGGLTTYVAPASDGAARPTVAARPVPPPTSQTSYLHTLIAGESLESLAYRFLGSSELWWQIADANPVAFPSELAPGALVAIPTGQSAGLVVRTRTF